MIVNASSLIALQQSFNALFQQSLQSVTPLWPQVAMEVLSTHKQELHQWLGRVPQMIEWIDVKNVKVLRGAGMTITNKDFEATIAVDRNDIEDDMLGMYQPRIRELSVRAALHPDKLLSLKRQAGTTDFCYDGKTFYSDTHVEGDSGTNDNLLGGTGTTSSALATDFRTARAALMGFKDDQGEPFIEPAMITGASGAQWMVTCPPALHGTFEELQKAGQISSTTNVLMNAFTLIVDSRLTDVNDWYLDYIGGIIKPFIKQTRRALAFVSLTDPNSTERVFMQKQFLYGVESRGAVDFGLYQYSAKIVNT
jgi:phage major head subunit gpT-like protein